MATAVIVIMVTMVTLSVVVMVCVDGCDGDSGIIDGDMVDSCGYNGDSGYDNISFSCDGDSNCSCDEDQSDDPGIKICFVEWHPACDVLSKVFVFSSIVCWGGRAHALPCCRQRQRSV